MFLAEIGLLVMGELVKTAHLDLEDPFVSAGIDARIITGREAVIDAFSGDLQIKHSVCGKRMNIASPQMNKGSCP